MTHKKDAIKKATEIIDSHLKNDLSESDAKLASIVTVETMLSVGIYPAWQSLYQRVLNYLTSLILNNNNEKNNDFI